MIPPDFSAQYAVIVCGLDPAAIDAMWAALLRGQNLEDEQLAQRARDLDALRDAIGRASARRHRDRNEFAPTRKTDRP